ncbi:hypothetical protein B566_EDAN015685 [Ephemera danica]|nr:hypothetical protein B566_EDAN015685 [Ephemera danica]
MWYKTRISAHEFRIFLLSIIMRTLVLVSCMVACVVACSSSPQELDERHKWCITANDLLTALKLHIHDKCPDPRPGVILPATEPPAVVLPVEVTTAGNNGNHGEGNNGNHGEGNNGNHGEGNDGNQGEENGNNGNHGEGNNGNGNDKEKNSRNGGQRNNAKHAIFNHAINHYKAKQ